jgi:hypothetical protein
VLLLQHIESLGRNCHHLLHHVTKSSCTCNTIDTYYFSISIDRMPDVHEHECMTLAPRTLMQSHIYHGMFSINTGYREPVSAQHYGANITCYGMHANPCDRMMSLSSCFGVISMSSECHPVYNMLDMPGELDPTTKTNHCKSAIRKLNFKWLLQFPARL